MVDVLTPEILNHIASFSGSIDFLSYDDQPISREISQYYVLWGFWRGEETPRRVDRYMSLTEATDRAIHLLSWDNVRRRWNGSSHFVWEDNFWITVETVVTDVGAL